LAAIQAGAVDYMLKRVGDIELVQTIERVSRGEGYLDSSMTTTIFKQVHMGIEARHAAAFARLRLQEIAVLVLVSKGMTNRQIAVQLDLGEGSYHEFCIYL